MEKESDFEIRLADEDQIGDLDIEAAAILAGAVEMTDEDQDLSEPVEMTDSEMAKTTGPANIKTASVDVKNWLMSGQENMSIEAFEAIRFIASKVWWSFPFQSSDLDDLLQDTVIAVWENRHKYDRMQNPAPWIKRIAINLAIDRHRGQPKRPTLLGDKQDWVEDRGRETDNDEPHVETGLLKAATAARDALSGDERELLDAWRPGGPALTGKQRVRKHRLMKKLKKIILRRQLEDDPDAGSASQ